jgi:hypothetical protein
MPLGQLESGIHVQLLDNSLLDSGKVNTEKLHKS